MIENTSRRFYWTFLVSLHHPRQLPFTRLACFVKSEAARYQNDTRTSVSQLLDVRLKTGANECSVCKIFSI